MHLAAHFEEHVEGGRVVVFPRIVDHVALELLVVILPI